jgi:subtilisin family serine protease
LTAGVLAIAAPLDELGGTVPLASANRTAYADRPAAQAKYDESDGMVRAGEAAIAVNPAPQAADDESARILAGPSAESPDLAQDDAFTSGVWLLKWREGADADPARLPGTVVRTRQPELRVDAVAPAEGEDPERWMERLAAHPDVAYVHPAGRVKLLAAVDDEGRERTDAASVADARALSPAPADASARTPSAVMTKTAMDLPGKPDDPLLGRQTYLSLIGADRAWALAPGMATDLTIAVVDTGIDLDHPDLKDNLVAGINLISPGKPPDDDNGHGTRVAGVLAASGNNGIGTAGVLWKAKIMPVKALDSSGFGDEQVLGEAIVKAVDAGAKIVVLSVGLYRYSPYMRDVVLYAEKHGVLLVAASGNDGRSKGDKAAVKYPAAYPTVLAVAGAAADGSPERGSNAGPEIDIAAAWEVYTTARGGGYRQEEGTSMAAPQVAAAAALVWTKEPNLKVWQVRERLMQTAQDIGAPGRDNQSGAGLLRVDLALSAAATADAREPNDTRQRAAALPVTNQIAGALSGGSDTDWFRIDVPHDGWLSLAFEGHPGEQKSHPAVSATLHASGGTVSSAEWLKDAGPVEWQVKRGTAWLELKLRNGSETAVVPYTLTTGFRMAADAHEPNDTQATARPIALADGRAAVTGTFHQQGDLDWFAVTIAHTGNLKLTLAVDTMRMDPALLVKPEGGAEQRIDDYGDGSTERANLPVTPGRYLIRVRDVSSPDAHPVVGTYTLTLEFEQRYEDPNEPNDRIYQATSLVPGTEYRGVFAARSDEDWFRFRLDGRALVTIALDGVPEDIRVRLEVYDRRQQLMETFEAPSGAGSIRIERVYDEGQHYIRLTAERPFDRSLYRLRVNVEPLTGGFRDIAGHWAQDSIVRLNALGLVSGTGDYRFEPDRGITRAEAVALLMRALAGSDAPAAQIAYRDLSVRHWAYKAVQQATAAGIVNGLPDGSFGPARPVTRAEAAVMVGRALGLSPLGATNPRFADLQSGHWAAPMINRLNEEGILSGSPGGLVRPDAPISRAEFAVLLVRALEKGRMS